MAECQYTGKQTMATESSETDIKQFTCGICMDHYKMPRYLPTCGHTFCENCLLTHANNLQQQGSKLECPVCRKTLSFPENKQVTLEWIQTFPLNSVIVKMMESESPEQNTSAGVAEAQSECDPCKELGETIVGFKFCLDCQEVYCKECTDSHKKFKMSRNHILIDNREIPTEAGCTELFKGFAKCPNHPEWDIELFCKSHDVVICAICAAHGHDKSCDIVGVLNHDSDATNLREESEKLASQMKEALDHLSMLKSFREESKKNLKKKLKKIRDDIEQVRDQVVTLMDNVVRHVAEVTKQVEIENVDRLDEELSGISKIKEQVEENTARLDTVSQHGSEKHKFISSHLMKIQSEEIDFKICEEDYRLKQIDAELQIADDIRKLLAESTNVEKLVEVTVNERESGHKHFGGISNYLRDSKMVRVEEQSIRPNVEHQPLYWAIAMYNDGRIILGDNCKENGCGYLCLYNPEDDTMMKLKLKYPRSVTQIDDTHLAVSISEDNTINIVSVGKELNVEKTLKTQTKPKNIVALNNGHLAVAWMDPPAFGVVDISGTEIVQKLYLDQDKSGRKFNSFIHMAVDEKRQHVIQSCIEDKIVYCFDFTGEPVFGYSGPGLSEPRNVALDACGNVYVCNRTHRGSIYKISPEGKLLSIITEGVPSYPYAICSDLSGTAFLVARVESSQLDKVVYFRLEQNTDT